jgi:hypothetical protein
MLNNGMLQLKEIEILYVMLLFEGSVCVYTVYI